MFALSGDTRFHLYNQPTDMRLSFDGLSGLVQNNLGTNPGNGEVFIFINKSRDKVKLLQWQGGGFVLYYKRLEKGTFELPRYDSSVGSICINYATLVMIIDGLSIKNIQKRKRYQGPSHLLRDFKGYLQTDGYSVYDIIAKREEIIHLNCMAHARRGFDKALTVDKQKAEYALDMFQQLYAIGHKVNEKRETRICLQKKDISSD